MAEDKQLRFLFLLLAFTLMALVITIYFFGDESEWKINGIGLGGNSQINETYENRNVLMVNVKGSHVDFVSCAKTETFCKKVAVEMS